MARVGKIARLPVDVREELCRRIREGQLGPQLLPWLNELEDVKEVLGMFFGGQPINAQNLSDWRQGGYKEWLEKSDNNRGKADRIRELSLLSMQLAKANGGNLSEGAATVLGGSILEVLEQLEGLRSAAAVETDPEKFGALSEAISSMTLAVARLRKGDIDRERIRQKDQDLELAQKAFDQRLKEYQDKVEAQKAEILGAVTAAREGGLSQATIELIEQKVKLL